MSTDIPLTAVTEDRRAKRNVAVLVAAQALVGAQMPMIFVIGGLAGQMLAPNPCLATLPISLIVFGSMTTAPWLSSLMQMAGRRTGFLIGTLGGLAGAAICVLALSQASFGLFLLGSYLTGIYMSAQGFYRSAAADTASAAFRPKAISYVMAGGLGAAIIGPQLVKVTVDLSVVTFAGTYAVVIAINLVGMLLFLALDLPKPPPPEAGAAPARSRADLLRDPVIAVAIVCAMVSYALMNLVMTSTPLAVVGCGFSEGTAADVVTGHVLAMFAPSFFTGHLIARFGATRIVAIGLAILGAAGVVALQGVELENFFVALILLGVGWNFGFIGATAMLADAHAPEERGRVQGLNDLIVFGGVVVASLASGGLMNCAGGSAEAGWSAVFVDAGGISFRVSANSFFQVNLAMLPLLTLAGAALIWLTLRPAE